MKKLVLLFVAILLVGSSMAQVPSSFSYQAVVKNATGNIVSSGEVSVKVSILRGSVSGNTVYSEIHDPVMVINGLIKLAIGTGTTSDDFNDIDWSKGPCFIKIEMDLQGGTNFTHVSTSELLSVPYAKVSEKTLALDDILSGKLEIVGDADASPDSALFVVKDKNGNIVFAVYENGVVVYVDENAKGSRAGFAVGGRSTNKGYTSDLLLVSPDSIRVYVNDDPVKGSRAGFAVICRA